eukprot:sb/3468530/
MATDDAYVSPFSRLGRGSRTPLPFLDLGADVSLGLIRLVDGGTQGLIRLVDGGTQGFIRLVDGKKEKEQYNPCIMATDDAYVSPFSRLGRGSRTPLPFLDLGADVSLGLIRLVDGGTQGFIRLVDGKKEKEQYKPPPNRQCETIRDMEHDSGELIIIVTRYEMWNMIRGSLLDDMRHDSEEKTMQGLYCSFSFFPSTNLMNPCVPDPNNALRFFLTYPNSLIGLNIAIRSWLITVKNFMNSLKKDVFYHYVKKELFV